MENNDKYEPTRSDWEEFADYHDMITSMGEDFDPPPPGPCHPSELIINQPDPRELDF